MQKPIQRRSPVIPPPSKPAEASKANPLRDSLRGMDFAAGEAALSPVQAKGKNEDTEGVHEAARHGASGGGAQIPFMDKIQKSFGVHDISSVKSHTGAKAQEGAAAMGAAAYASGNDVVFGQSPDLHTAAHEAAHVVQQRAGVSLGGGVGRAGDAYERQADAVADKVVKGESVEGMLEAGGSAAGQAVQKLGDEDEQRDGRLNNLENKIRSLAQKAAKKDNSGHGKHKKISSGHSHDRHQHGQERKVTHKAAKEMSLEAALTAYFEAGGSVETLGASTLKLLGAVGWGRANLRDLQASCKDSDSDIEEKSREDDSDSDEGGYEGGVGDLIEAQ